MSRDDLHTPDYDPDRRASRMSETMDTTDDDHDDGQAEPEGYMADPEMLPKDHEDDAASARRIARRGWEHWGLGGDAIGEWLSVCGQNRSGNTIRRWANRYGWTKAERKVTPGTLTAATAAANARTREQWLDSVAANARLLERVIEDAADETAAASLVLGQISGRGSAAWFEEIGEDGGVVRASAMMLLDDNASKALDRRRKTLGGLVGIHARLVHDLVSDDTAAAEVKIEVNLGERAGRVQSLADKIRGHLEAEGVPMLPAAAEARAEVIDDDDDDGLAGVREPVPA